MNRQNLMTHNLQTASKTYIIAEVSANHNGKIDTAKECLRSIQLAGADAVKLQTYTPDTMTLDCDSDVFRVGEGTLWAGRTLHDLYAEAHTPWEWHGELFALAKELGMDCFSTPFDRTAVDFLEQFDPPAYKIASFELVDLPLIQYVASKGRPIIMSTGMGSLSEIAEAVAVVKAADVPLTLLKCTSAYPSPPESMNLRTIPHLAEAFGVPTGLSDHTLGTAVPVAAVALGACVIEKHFTLSRETPGPDSAFSLEPHEFKEMVDAVRVTEKALGKVNYELTDKEQASKSFRRSLFAVEDIEAGERLTEKNVRSIRPGSGLPPKHLPTVVGRCASQRVARGTPLAWTHVR
ncbi:pseudaminic acid synthase [Roseimaritima sediminicola]|uniref:pseudaminic acid synthase n=1 Tax=Roseimaritima sediminicola TaxID=2662066 RepID=UPI0012983E64|nr:pseudaminic acid synthase [Roseimaritima sediminicola]